MEQRDLHIGDVIQIDPEAVNTSCCGCFMMVTEPKPWGAKGFISIPSLGGEPPRLALSHATWRELKYVGRAAWVLKKSEMMSEQEVKELMESATSPEDWDAKCDLVKSRCNGYPEFWYRLILASGLVDRILALFGSSTEIRIESIRINK